MYTSTQLKVPVLIAHDGSPGTVQSRASLRMNGVTLGCANIELGNANTSFVPNTTVEFLPYGRW
ncbi:MAG: hypothetical protein ACK511_11900 [Burkholderiales bacterium]|nr:hypothetical protein [Betaproteobacteria bacterium]